MAGNGKAEARTEELATMFVELELEEAKLKSRRKVLVADILNLVAEPPEKGTVTLVGKEHRIKLVYKQNTTYPDKTALQEVVVELGDKGEELFRMDLKARDSKVDEWIVENMLGANAELATRLKDLQKVNAGTTSVKVEPNV